MIKKRKKAIHRNEVGRRYGRLVIIARAPDSTKIKSNKSYPRWLCKCDCDSMTVVYQGNLRREYTKSCGCLMLEVNRKKQTTHGESHKTKEYLAWKLMTQRCCDKNQKGYMRYGGRGIRICKRWRGSYLNFLADVGRAPSPRHSIGRIDNDGDYEPGNVRWETATQQANNRRSNHFIMINGAKHTIAEWSRITGINHGTIMTRIRRGYNPSDAVLIIPGELREKHKTEAA